MNAVRTVLSALCILIGAALLAMWAAAWVALTAIEDSTVIEDSTARALASNAAKEAIIETGTERTLLALSTAGVSLDIPGLETAVETLVAAVVNSGTFSQVVHSQAGSIREQVVTDLNGPGVGSVTVTLDFTEAVNAGLGELPFVGDSIPHVKVPGVPVEVMDEDTGDSARLLWDRMHVAKQWFGWLGLTFLALGMVVSYRKRWYLMKVAWAIAAISAAVWAFFTFAEPQTIANLIPGGVISNAIVLELIASAEGPVATNMAYVALGSTALALVLYLIAAAGNRD